VGHGIRPLLVGKDRFSGFLAARTHENLRGRMGEIESCGEDRQYQQYSAFRELLEELSFAIW